jgi:hypothetical protein
MIGRIISHYSILEKLGAGGMGDIYKAQDTRLNRFVAIKVLSTANAGDVERRRRFVQEAQAASALNHPNIITIYDVVSVDGLELMVMEFVSGLTLDDLTPKHGLDAQKTLDIAAQIADALQTAHAAGIIHRDLKPGNVMVTGRGLVKILDFGIAKLTGPIPARPDTDETLPIDAPMTVEGSILGTVCYMSPEQAQAKIVDFRSDIFSFGLVLYEMLTGRKAFSGDSALSTLSSILRDEPKPIGDLVLGVPKELQAIVQRAMRKAPDQRWQSMQEMRAALMALKVKADSGVLRTQVGTGPVVAVRGRKKPDPRILVASVTVMVLVTLLGGWWLIRNLRKGPPHEIGRVAPAAVPVPLPAPPPSPPDASAPAPTETPAPVDTAMTNQHVLDMVEAKVPSVTILSQINAASKTNFDLSTKGVIALTKGGVSPAIIEAMRNPKAESTFQRPTAGSAAPTLATPASTAPVKINTVSVLGGLPFEITLAQDVPAKLTAAQKISFTVSKDFKVGDVVVIAKGTPLSGEVVDAGDSKKLLVVKGKATFKLTTVDAIGGGKLAIRATPAHTDKVEHVIESPSKNKDVLARAGDGYLAYIDNDQTVTIKH